eukprot:scaffold2253_cov119-Cylindrotheca_fusiformis.AAC.14
MRSLLSLHFILALGLIVSDYISEASDGEETCSAADGTCTSDIAGCIDNDSQCEIFAARGECDSNPKWMLQNCPVSCKHCPEDYELHGSVQQSLVGSGRFEVTPKMVVDLLKSTKTYMTNLSIKEELKAICKNEHEMCATWALNGECDANPKCKHSVDGREINLFLGSRLNTSYISYCSMGKT